LSEERVNNFKAAFDEFRNENMNSGVVFVSNVLEKYRTIREDNERLVSANTSPDDRISSEQLNTRSPLQNE